MTWTPTRPPAALCAGATVAAIAVSGALLLGACSSSSSGSPADAAPSGSGTATVAASASGGSGGDQRQAMDAYRRCLGQHGVTLPTFNRPSGGARPSGRPSGGARRGGYGFPGMGPGGASPDAATQKAMDACVSLRPQFGGRGGAGGAGGGSAFQAFASCLKDHGVVLPTASPGTRGGRRGPGMGLNTADPKVGAAYAICKQLLPQRTSPSNPS